MKIYLVCEKTKRALSIGHRDWAGPTGHTEFAGTPEEATYFINTCAPHVEASKRSYLEEIRLFCDGNPVYATEEQYLEPDIRKVSGHWETAYIDVPKVKRRKVGAA